MKECWSEGDLRAYLDRELAPEAMERAAAHLAECPECSSRREILASRAAKVSVWMDELAQPAEPLLARTPARNRKRWAWGALPGAAAILVAILVAPQHRKVPPAPVAKVAPAPAVHQSEPVPVAQVAVMRPQPRRHHSARPHRQAASTETFVALDNEPFEAGWVVRMALGPDQIPADVVFSADGRARAYRLVGSSSN